MFTSNNIPLGCRWTQFTNCKRYGSGTCGEYKVIFNINSIGTFLSLYLASPKSKKKLNNWTSDLPNSEVKNHSIKIEFCLLFILPINTFQVQKWLIQEILQRRVIRKVEFAGHFSSSNIFKLGRRPCRPGSLKPSFPSLKSSQTSWIQNRSLRTGTRNLEIQDIEGVDVLLRPDLARNTESHSNPFGHIMKAIQWFWDFMCSQYTKIR